MAVESLEQDTKMKKTILSIFILAAVIIFNNCSTDFDMYADYEDVTIVYGITDFSDDTTWVKITKAFTGPGNILLIAQNPDSSNYPYKLDATITGRKNGTDLEPMQLDTITIHNKAITDTVINNEGDTVILNPFYSPSQLMYYTTETLDQDAEYKLTINKADGAMTASTGIVNSFNINKPNSRFAFSKTSDGTIEWYSAKNGMRNEVTLRFNYLEYASGYSDTLHKYVQWYVGSKDSKTIEGSEKLVISYSGQYFFDLLETELEPVPNVERWADSVYMTIACGSQVLSTYIDINSNAGSLLEEVPIYSNIEGGSGIFASRHTVMKPIRLSLTTERTLIEDHNLGFKFKTK